MKKVEAFAKKLGLRIRKHQMEGREKTKSDSSELYQLMQSMADSGGLTSIKDPVAWQNEVREDRKLYGRE